MSYSLALLVLAGAFAGNVAAADLPLRGSLEGEPDEERYCQHVGDILES
jgi:hypothetical protein